LVLAKLESQQSFFRMKELEKQETRCGWASLDRLGRVDWVVFPSDYGISLSAAALEAGGGASGRMYLRSDIQAALFRFLVE
jgi:hypothetical protein